MFAYLYDLPIQGGSCGPGESPIDVGASSAVCMDPQMAAQWGASVATQIGQGGQAYNPYAPIAPSYPFQNLGTSGLPATIGGIGIGTIALIALAFFLLRR